ncbi:4-alpha-glucanotransferase [Desulfobaculum xiamenense]|uniref:4-alpha-glucanotransferase n=1 Tax=Desulfobaculum xiamenense TaxID=995050 RepID=A0A846QRL9_9BACT|nr:4-alpha-glucanotransferase [Desulfobaculum xiamenense]NJB68035.1 4-alpha-glucanotransferase [Desulfobaculum xiamenense]
MMLRSSGILMHPTSLPSPHGIGGLGDEAYAFADFLHRTGQRVWQLLPLTPTAETSWNDPYHSVSAFAGNPLLICPSRMAAEGWLDPADVANPPAFPEDSVDFAAVTRHKFALFAKAYARFSPAAHPAYAIFREEQADWLDDYALFVALRGRYGGKPWTAWPDALRDRNPDALARARADLAEDMDFAAFLQWIFHRQWTDLRRHCHGLGIQLFGDMPIYVDHDSADLWRSPQNWKLDENLQPRAMAGVPPDYFSATGQLWESPVYDWDVLRDSGFDWWIRRILRNLDLFDMLRIDHFRGLAAYWEVPAGERTAMNGQWIEAPAEELLEALHARRAALPLVAEDLGVITPDVREIMHRFGLPGMKILLFAFGPDMARNPYIPHNIGPHSVVYTGTHDNNPTLGWFDDEADAATRERLFAYLGLRLPRTDIPWALVRMALLSHANLAIIPTQDLLCLGSEARMNRPGHLKGNWHWRMRPESLTTDIETRLAALTRISGRATPEAGRHKSDACPPPAQRCLPFDGPTG